MKNESLVKRIAMVRMRRLLSLAESRTVENTVASRRLAKRYTGIAVKISTHYKVKIPRALGLKVCKKCGNFMVPGINCKVRLASAHGYVAYACECGNEMHVHYRTKRSGGA